MTLLIDELYPGIVFEQNFRIQRDVSLAHVRPWIYKHGAQLTGTLTLEIARGGTILKTATINFADINAEIPGTYAHGQVRLDFDALQLNHDTCLEYTEYTLRLYNDNYTLNTEAFIGAIRRYELKFYNTYGDGVVAGEAPNDMIEPLGFELFEYNY